MIRRPPRSTLDRSSAASDVYKRQVLRRGRCSTAVQSVQRHIDLRHHPHLDPHSRQGERKILTTRAACLLATAAALGLPHTISAQRNASLSPSPADLIVTNARIYTVC